MRLQEETAKRDADDLLRQLQDEQRRSSTLSQEISSSSSSRQSLQQAQEKINDLLKDNSILREANEKLLNSAFDIERERKYVATENALKVQISQLETTLKSGNFLTNQIFFYQFDQSNIFFNLTNEIFSQI